ncbi:MAG: hypothetical protein A2136_08030 [Chloroflexi bacterium RBG_16_54_11]|nr:MAG: hypothetical protein A2136_08030 [Chloroflexi bacterium RBG_16_54_11]
MVRVDFVEGKWLVFDALTHYRERVIAFDALTLLGRAGSVPMLLLGRVRVNPAGVGVRVFKLRTYKNLPESEQTFNKY